MRRWLPFTQMSDIVERLVRLASLSVDAETGRSSPPSRSRHWPLAKTIWS